MASIQDVFKTQGQPTVTYVKRDGGRFERELSQGIDSRGSLCLLTGPSKTGKTTLYQEVARSKKLEVLQVRCHADLTATEFWKQALEKVKFDRVSGQQLTAQRGRVVEGDVGGKIGWAWLADVAGKVSANISSGTSEAEIRAMILADPSPDHIIPVLKSLAFLLVIEDFHYLKQQVKTTVFQQWKAFVDQEVSVVVVGTTHHAVDLACSNPDLISRITQIDLESWSLTDLEEIVTKGFRHLGVGGISMALAETIAKESVGLPIVTQAVCQQLLINKQLEDQETAPGAVSFTRQDAFDAMHDVAASKFKPFIQIYEHLVRGPRHGARKHNTYELVLSAFTLDPLKFSLLRSEITERLNQLRSVSGSPVQIPPPAAVTATLNALARLQNKLPLMLLEWSPNDQRLFIVEPTFLFYLRWKKRRKAPPTLRDVLSEMFSVLTDDKGISV